MVAVGARQSLQNLSNCARVKCLVRPRDQNENSSARSRATTGCPMKLTVARTALFGGRARLAALASSISTTGINTVNTEIQNPGISSVEPPPSWLAIGFSRGNRMRGEIHD